MGGMRRRGSMQSQEQAGQHAISGVVVVVVVAQELCFLFVHYYFNIMHPRCIQHSVGKWNASSRLTAAPCFWTLGTLSFVLVALFISLLNPYLVLCLCTGFTSHQAWRMRRIKSRIGAEGCGMRARGMGEL
jgi:hypothetical protein